MAAPSAKTDAPQQAVRHPAQSPEPVREIPATRRPNAGHHRVHVWGRSVDFAEAALDDHPLTGPMLTDSCVSALAPAASLQDVSTLPPSRSSITLSIAEVWSWGQI